MLMNSINTGKVIVGGVVAGIVMLVFGALQESLQGIFIPVEVPAETAAESSGGAGFTEPNNTAMMLYIVGIGIMIAWTYAAIRPRFGPGPGTAIKASTMVWACWTLFGFTTTYWLGILSGAEVVFGTVYAFVYMNVAGYVAAMMYQEDGGGGNAGVGAPSTETANEYVKN